MLVFPAFPQSTHHPPLYEYCHLFTVHTYQLRFIVNVHHVHNLQFDHDAVHQTGTVDTQAVTAVLLALLAQVVVFLDSA